MSSSKDKEGNASVKRERERERDELDEITINENPEKRIFLVKLPKFVHQEFFKHPEGFKLGDVSVDPETKEMKLKFAEVTDNMPSVYNLKRTQMQMGMKVFSEESSNVTFSGQIDAKMDMEPIEGDEQYEKLTKNRSVERNRKERTTVFMEGASDANMMKSSIFSNKEYIKHKKDKNTEKSVRMDKEALLDILFEAFENNPHWSLKSLIMHTHQPQQFLKETLAEVAIYNKRGPYKSLYEIKPELFDKRKQEKLDAPNSSTSTTTTTTSSTPTSR